MEVSGVTATCAPFTCATPGSGNHHKELQFPASAYFVPASGILSQVCDQPGLEDAMRIKTALAKPAIACDLLFLCRVLVLAESDRCSLCIDLG